MRIGRELTAILLCMALLVGCSVGTSAETGKARPLPRSTSRLPLAEITSDHYSLNHMTDARSARELLDSLEVFRTHFLKTFRQAGFRVTPPRHRMGWVLFNRSRHFDDYVRSADRIDASWFREYYSARTNRVAMTLPAPMVVRAEPRKSVYESDRLVSPARPRRVRAEYDRGFDIERVTHEAAHQLAFNCGLQKRGVMYPVWVSEGLATNFETEDPASGGPATDNRPRRHYLVRAMERGRLIPLKHFVTATRVPADDDELAGDLYDQSWGFFRFVFEKRRSQLRRYLAALHRVNTKYRSRERRLQEFTAAFGDPEDLEDDWIAYIESLRDRYARRR